MSGISLVIAARNISFFPVFALQEFCTGINRFIDNFLLPLEFLSAQDGFCYTSKATLGIGFYVLFCSGMLGLLSTAYVNSITRAAIQDREALLLCEKNGDKEGINHPLPLYRDENLGIFTLVGNTPYNAIGD